MMSLFRGDVVLIDYPYTDRTGSKVRPCVVVQSDDSNKTLDDTIVALMTSKTRFTQISLTELLITAQSPVGRQAGLIFDSAIQAHNILTIDCGFIRRKIGSLPADAMLLVDQCLKAALGLT